jgi:hypothetical protein
MVIINFEGFQVLASVFVKCGNIKEETDIENYYEELYLLGYNALYSAEFQPTFQRNISPPSSGSKNKPNKKPAQSMQQAVPEP